MKATQQLSCTYIDKSFSRFFLQVKNILSYNCIRKPNIIQINIIDCMELRSAEIRSHIVIRRTSRVYSLCVFRLLQPGPASGYGRDRMMSTLGILPLKSSSFTESSECPCTKSILITCRVFKSSLHVVFESS